MAAVTGTQRRQATKELMAMVQMVLVTLALLIAGVLALALATRLTARTKHRWTSPASSGEAQVR
jgi:hypothetical protein